MYTQHYILYTLYTIKCKLQLIIFLYNIHILKYPFTYLVKNEILFSIDIYWKYTTIIFTLVIIINSIYCNMRNV